MKRASTARSFTAGLPVRGPHLTSGDTDDQGRARAHHAAHPGSATDRADHLRRQGPGHVVPADRDASSTGGRAERPRHPARRRRIRRVERLRRAVPHPDRRTAGRGRPPVQPLPHDGAVRADAAGVADRAQPSLRVHGEHHRDRDLGTGSVLGPTQHQGATGHDAQAERILDRSVRQVPRGARLADVVDGALRRLALWGRRLRDLLRVHRGREQPVRPSAVRRHDAGRAARHRRGGVPPHRGPDRPGGELDPPAEGADARQALLRLLRPRGHARPAPRRAGMDREVPREVRPRLGRPA